MRNRGVGCLWVLVLWCVLLCPAEGRPQSHLDPDRYEPNNVRTEAHHAGGFTLGFGTSIVPFTNFHSPEDSSDWYKLVINGSPGRYRLTITAEGERGINPIVTVDGIQEQPAFTQAPRATSATVHAFYAHDTGKEFWIEVRRSPDDAASGRYTLTLSSERLPDDEPRVGYNPPHIRSLEPENGPVGSPVLVRGDNLLTVSSVSFTGPDSARLNAVYKALSATELRVTVPPNAVTGPLVLAHAGGHDSAAFTVTAPTASAQAQNSSGEAVAPENSEGGCCLIRPAELKGRLGRLLVRFPDASIKVEAKIDVYKSGERKRLAGGYGNRSFYLPPGIYDVIINGKRVNGVIVRLGHETHVRTGALHVASDKKGRVDVRDPLTGKVISTWYGDKAYGFPIGQIGVKNKGRSKTVMIEDGQVTDF